MWRHTGVHADWRRSCTYGRASNAIDISHGSLTCPSYTDKRPPFLYGDSDTPPHLVAFYDTLGIRRTYYRLKPPAVLGGTPHWEDIHFRRIKTRIRSRVNRPICPLASYGSLLLLMDQTPDLPFCFVWSNALFFSFFFVLVNRPICPFASYGSIALFSILLRTGP